MANAPRAATYHIIRARLCIYYFFTKSQTPVESAFLVLSPLALVTLRCAVFGHEPTLYWIRHNFTFKLKKYIYGTLFCTLLFNNYGTVYPRIMARATIFSNKVFPRNFAATIRDCAINRGCVTIRCMIKNF